MRYFCTQVIDLLVWVECVMFRWAMPPFHGWADFLGLVRRIAPSGFGNFVIRSGDLLV